MNNRFSNNRYSIVYFTIMHVLIKIVADWKEGESNWLHRIFRTEIQISRNVYQYACIYFLLVKISFLPLWFNIILSSFSQLCLLLPLPVRVFPSGIFELFSLSWNFFFFFFDILMLLLFLITATRFFLSFLLFWCSQTLILLYRLYRRNYFFSPFFLASSCRFLHF